MVSGVSISQVMSRSIMLLTDHEAADLDSIQTLGL